MRNFIVLFSVYTQSKLKMRTEGLNSSTFHFNQEGNVVVMETDSNYRQFCQHVRKIIAIVCGVELILLIWMLIAGEFQDKLDIF
jgi:hypothetical protein